MVLAYSKQTNDPLELGGGGGLNQKHMTFISVYMSGYVNTGHSKYINKLWDKTIFCDLNIVTLSGLDVGIIRSVIKLCDPN